jgi:hypothetical protein
LATSRCRSDDEREVELEPGTAGAAFLIAYAAGSSAFDALLEADNTGYLASRRRM